MPTHTTEAFGIDFARRLIEARVEELKRKSAELAPALEEARATADAAQEVLTTLERIDREVDRELIALAYTELTYNAPKEA